MPDCDGIQMLKLIRDFKSEARVVLVSGVDKRTVDTALRLGEILNLNMDGSLQKPVLVDALRGKLFKSRDARSVIEVDDLRSAIHNGSNTTDLSAQSRA